MQRHVDAALASGAKALTGGKRGTDQGFFYEPTVLVDVRDDMPVMREETFGPILPIATFDGEAEALAPTIAPMASAPMSSRRIGGMPSVSRVRSKPAAC